MKYVRQLVMPANLSHKDLLDIKKDDFHCDRDKIDCRHINCAFCMVDEPNKIYFDHWFKTMYKGERLKEGKMSITLEGKKLL